MIFSRIEVEGRPAATQGTGGMVSWRTVTPGFFSALRIPIRRGRAFSEDDRQPGEGAIILGESLARRLFGDVDPVGKRLRLGTPEWHTVVGIAAGIANSGYGPREPEYHLPWRYSRGPIDPQMRQGQRHATVMIRSSWSPAAVERWLKKEVAAIDPSLPISVEPMSRRVSELAARPRFHAMLLTLFALTGMALAVIGL
jgi:hypothetical protein